MRTSVPQYNVRMTGWKEPKTYCEDRHGDGVVMMVTVMMVIAMEMVIAQARELMLMLWVDDRPTWGLLSSLSKPHDLPYPMQPYANQAVVISQLYKS